MTPEGSEQGENLFELPRLISAEGANILHDAFSELGNEGMFEDGEEKIQKAISMMVNSLNPVEIDGNVYYNSEELIMWYRVTSSFSIVDGSRIVDLSPETVNNFKNHISLYESKNLNEDQRKHLKSVCRVLMDKIRSYLEANGQIVL
jgi:hypothetical protein